MKLLGAALSLALATCAHATPISWGIYSSGFSPVTHTYDSGSGTETAPAGATRVVISLWGPGTPGICFSDPFGSQNNPGGGGGAAVKTIAVTGGDALSYAVGTSVTTSSVSGSVTGGSVSMSAAASGSTSGGTASGGDVNYMGGTGAYPVGGNGANGGGLGGSVAGASGSPPGGGGAAGTALVPGVGCSVFPGYGANGRISFAYT